MNDKTHSTSDELTRVDLGDDLIEKTAILTFPEETKPKVANRNENKEELAPSLTPVEKSIKLPETVEDLLHSARILTNEGLLDDAKKILHRILIKDSSNAVARQQLDEVHAQELKQLFGETEGRKPVGRRIKSEVSFDDSESIMRQLDQDLNLGVFSDRSFSARVSELSLLQDPKLVNLFCLDLEKDLESASIQDWIDLGIGFLEMDLAQIAVRLFTGACKRLDLEFSTSSMKTDGNAYLSATFLLAFSLIVVGRPYEAISKIQPLLSEIHLQAEQKIELFYLMGRTYESMKKWNLAIEFYEQVLGIDAHYRDVDLRIQRIRESKSG